MQKSLICLLLAVTIASSQAEASELESSNSNSQFFAATDLGISEQVFDTSGFENDSETDLAYSISAGYHINPNVSFSIGYVDYGNPTLLSVNSSFIGNIKLKSDASAIVALVTLSTNNLDSNWNYYANLGLARNSFTIDSEAQENSVNLIKETKNGFVGGVGTTYSFSTQLQLIMEGSWNVYSVDSGMLSNYLEISKLDVQLAKYSIGLKYNF